MNYFDLVIILLLVITFYTGFKNGLIKSIFSTVGYVAGGVTGLAAAVKYFVTWESQTQKVVLALLAILVGATIGEFILGKIGTVFQKILFISPFKLIDSTLGALLSVLRTSIILYLVATLLVFSPWSFTEDFIKPSKVYNFADSHLPEVLSNAKNEIVKLLKKVN